MGGGVRPHAQRYRTLVGNVYLLMHDIMVFRVFTRQTIGPIMLYGERKSGCRLVCKSVPSRTDPRLSSTPGRRSSMR